MITYPYSVLWAAVRRAGKRARLAEWRRLAGHWRRVEATSEAEDRVLSKGEAVLSLLNPTKSEGRTLRPPSKEDVMAVMDLLREAGIDPLDHGRE